MKISLNITKIKPSKDHKPLIEQVGIQELIIEDVASFMVDDNAIYIKYNTGTEDLIPLRTNTGEGDIEDWRLINLNVIRKFLEIDLSK